MPPDPALISALIRALENDPDSAQLRLHVAQLLLEAGAEASAMEHLVRVLAREPTNLQALELAAKAADSLGDGSRAAGYRKIRESLSQSAPTDSRDADPVDSSPDRGEASHPLPIEPESEAVAVPVGDEGEPGWWEVEDSGVTLADVGGMEDIKRRLHVAFIGPARNPELRKAYGKSLRGGLLLYGPPGCGKTFIARATAGELGAHFLAVGIADVLDMWLGASERNIKSIFDVARRHAPCVVFLDELDAIGQKRAQLRHHPAMRGVVNQLLAEMDGFASANEGIFVLGASNHPWDVDTALVRPGRFDRLALVLPPDKLAREAILRSATRDRPVEDLDFGWLANHTERFSGADLVQFVELATEQALEQSLAGGVVRKISMVDFTKALKEIKPSTFSWFEMARNFVLFANEGGAYDDLVAYMKQQKLL